HGRFRGIQASLSRRPRDEVRHAGDPPEPPEEAGLTRALTRSPLAVELIAAQVRAEGPGHLRGPRARRLVERWPEAGRCRSAHERRLPIVASCPAREAVDFGGE